MKLKSLYSICILGCFLLFSACKKDNYLAQNVVALTSGTQGDLNRIWIENNNTIHVVGGKIYDYTSLIYSIDGGYTWESAHFEEDPGKAVYAITQRNDKIYGAGLDGKMYFKNLNDNNWTYIQTRWWDWFKGISFPSDDYCIVVSGRAFEFGTLFKIDANGEILKADTMKFEMNDVQFVNDNVGYICGFGVVLKSTDGGNTWQHTTAKGDLFKTIFCLDQNHIWVVGYNGSILFSSDGGENWIRQRDGNNPLRKRYRLRSIHFIDAMNGYACGDKGLVLKTTDGGKNWMELKPFTENDLLDVKMQFADKIFVSGTNGTLFMIKE